MGEASARRRMEAAEGVEAVKRIAWLCTGGIITSFWRVQVLRETPTRFWVRVTAKSNLPKRGWVPAGTELYVPKHAVTFERPAVKHSLEG